MAHGTRAAGLRLVLPSAILFFAAAIRLAWSAENQTLWPDEAVHLLMAKSFAGLADYEIPASRPILLPLLWSLLYRIGLGERAIRAAGVGFSLLSVHLLSRLGPAWGQYAGEESRFGDALHSSKSDRHSAASSPPTTLVGLSASVASSVAPSRIWRNPARSASAIAAPNRTVSTPAKSSAEMHMGQGSQVA